MSGDLEAILETGSAAAVEIAASALAERGGTPGKCPSCGTSMIGPYCAVCGQERDTHRRSVFALLHDLVVDIVSFDSRILRTARALLVQPGELPRAFHEGRTRNYVPALRLYFFVSLIFFLVLSASGIAVLQFELSATPIKIMHDAKGNAFIPNPAYDPDDSDAKFMPRTIAISKEKASRPGGLFSYSTKMQFFSRIGTRHSNLTQMQRERLTTVGLDFDIGTDKKASNSKKSEAKAIAKWLGARVNAGVQRLAADPAAMNGPLTTWIPRILFLLLPLYALLLAIFYWRQRKTFYFVDHLIFSLSVHTFAFVVLLADVAAAQFLSGETVAWLSLLVLGIYIFFGIKRFYGQGWFWTTVKFGTVSFIYLIFFLLPALGTALALSFLDT